MNFKFRKVLNNKVPQSKSCSQEQQIFLFPPFE